VSKLARRVVLSLILGTLIALLLSSVPSPVTAQSLAPALGSISGEKLFGQQCGACHSVVEGEIRVGPSLANILGRRAGKSPGFNYSSALKHSSLKWDIPNLDRWLADSSAAIPGSVMGYRQPDAAKRKTIIAYLCNTIPQPNSSNDQSSGTDRK